jgi:hypothetical protein
VADLRSYLEEVSEADLAPTVGSMTRRKPRSGSPRTKTARRADKHVDNRTSHEVAEERHRLHKLTNTHRGFTK